MNDGEIKRKRKTVMRNNSQKEKKIVKDRVDKSDNQRERGGERENKLS